MAKSARIGEMKTLITVKRPTFSVDGDGYQVRSEQALFGGEQIWCKWVWEHGSEVYEHKRLSLGETAIITMFYTDEIDQSCRIWRNGDTGEDKAWEVVRVNNVEDSNRFIEITVRRDEPA